MSNVSSFWHLGQKISCFVCIYPAFFERPHAGQQTRLFLLPHGFPMDQGNNILFGEMGDFPFLEQLNMLNCRAGVEKAATYMYLLPPAPSTVPVEHTKKRKVCALSPEDTNYCFCKSNARATLNREKHFQRHKSRVYKFLLFILSQ